MTVEKVWAGEIQLGPTGRAELIILHPLGLWLEIRPRICVTFPVGNEELSSVFKQKSGLIKANFDGHVRDKKGRIET